MKRGLLILFVLVLFSSFAYANVYINEIMYNPSICSDSFCEWIEIYNNGTETVDLSNWFIIDGNYNRTIGNYNISIKEYLILARNDDKFEEFFGNNDSIWNESDGNYSIIMVSMSLLNGGETLILTNRTYNKSVTYDGKLADGNGKSLELINSSWVESLEDGGTPGRENTGNIGGGSSSGNEDLDVELSISNHILNLTDVLNISGNITTAINGSLTIKIARNISKNKTSWKYKWYLEENYNFSINNKTSFTKIFNKSIYWDLPDDLIVGNYKILVTLKYFDGNKSRFKYENEFFYINGLEDLGEHNVTIIKSPDSMRFGDIKTLFVRFDSNNYNFENLSFVAYLYSPRWTSIDLDDKTLRTRPYETNVAVNFDNMSRGQSVYVTLPLLSKRNCDDDFNNGNYKGKVRIYENTDEKIIEEVFSVKLSGVNDAMCPKTIVKSSGSKSSTTPILVANKEKNYFTHDDVKFTINIPKNITREFEVNITLKNPTSSNKEFAVWSYAYSSSLALMERQENKQEVSINSNETKTVVLKNIITKKDIPIKEYRVMVKIKSPNRESPKPYSTPVTLMISQKIKEKNKIKSFYTRAKKHSEKINLFASCENEARFVLESKKGVQIKNCTGTSVFEVEIEKGANLFYLSIEKDDELEDMEKMLVYSNGETLTYYKETTKIYELMNNYKEEDKGLGLVTGNIVSQNSVVYESSNSKLKKLIKYLLPTLFILLIGIFIVRRNGD